jgi:hypothetical protein
VKVIRTVVYRKSILYAVKCELAEGDTVGITARNLSGTWTVTEVTHRIRISENDIGEIAVLVRNHYGNDAGTYIRELHVCTL